MIFIASENETYFLQDIEKNQVPMGVQTKTCAHNDQIPWIYV